MLVLYMNDERIEVPVTDEGEILEKIENIPSFEYSSMMSGGGVRVYIDIDSYDDYDYDWEGNICTNDFFHNSCYVYSDFDEGWVRESQAIIMSDGRWCSEEYASDNFVHCEAPGCGEYLYDDEVYEHNGYYYCIDCYRDIMDENGEDMDDDDGDVIYGYHGYHGGYRPQKIGNEPELYLGFELEVDGCYNHGYEQKTVASSVLRNFPDFLHCEYDASVEFEFISQPATLEAHYENGYQEKMFDVLRPMTSSEESGRCGLHIHINRDFFNDEQYLRFKWILNFFKQEIFEFSRRGKWRNTYANFDDKVEKNQVDKEYVKGKYSAGHGTWFNEGSSFKTVEVRAFRGTLDYPTFMAALELVHNIAMAAVSGDDVVTWGSLLEGKYCREYAEKMGIYCEDILYMGKSEKEIRAEKVMGFADEISKYLWIEKTPLAIVALQKADNGTDFRVHTADVTNDGMIRRRMFLEMTGADSIGVDFIPLVRESDFFERINSIGRGEEICALLQ